MARGPAGKGGGTSRVRFVMMEAEIADGGDLAQFTQAMQNALRGPAPTTVIKRIAAPSLQANGGADTAEPEAIDETATEDQLEGDAAPPTAPRMKVRKPAPKPTVIPIDMSADVSFASYCEGKDTKSAHKRFLVSMAWLQEHRGISAVSDDHIYTCYMSIGWPTNLKDFRQPLRELKGRQLITQSPDGLFSLNHIGLDYAKRSGSE